MDINSILSNIPRVDDILCSSEIADLMDSIPRHIIVDTIREVLDETRKQIQQSIKDGCNDIDIGFDSLVVKIIEKAKKSSGRHLKRVINATGIIIHTNLGRSMLCSDAAEAVLDVAENYSNLEYSLEDGERGSRYSHIEYIMTRITGAESAVVVNNNAAAVLVVLAALCRGREAVVSRGELVEIGGSFRIPEVMEQSGAVLREVGTTNRTHLYDYQNAIGDNTGLLLKVHTSNYRILGFTESVAGRELTALGASCGIPVVEDIGSGSFIDLSKYGLDYEPTVQEAIKSGMDIVTFSGDKMLGGPQAGIIAGRKKYIDVIRKHPLMRAVRVDKMTLAALEATLRKYMDEETAANDIPTLKMITEARSSLESRAKRLMDILKASISDYAYINMVNEYSQVGGGSLPTENIPTIALGLRPKNMSVNMLEKLMRESEPPVIARVQKDNLLMDIRTIREDEYMIISNVLANIMQECL